MKDLVTPRQVAQAINVSESSLKRWCDQGLIPTVRTAGGHRRLLVNGVLSFLRESGYPLVNPEILGLPPATQGGRGRKLTSERDRLIAALVGGDEAACVEIVLNLYLAEIPLSVICDDVFAPVLSSIGDKWGCGEVAVWQERRSCEICHRVLHEMRRALPELPATAPIAVGGTVDGDPYTLASAMAEVTLREHGWRASSLGSMIPFLSLRQAMCDMRPKLFWLSVSVVRDPPGFLEEFRRLSELAAENQVAVVVGGKALTPELRKQMRYAAHCDTFGHLEQFAAQLHPSPRLARLPVSPASTALTTADHE